MDSIDGARAPPSSSDESSEKWQGRFRSRADDSSERHEGWDGVWALPVPLHLTRRTLRNAVHLIKPLSDIRDKFHVFPSKRAALPDGVPGSLSRFAGSCEKRRRPSEECELFNLVAFTFTRSTDSLHMDSFILRLLRF